MALALIGLAIVWAVMLLFGAMEFDRGLLLYFYAGERPEAAAVARWVTELGGGPVLLGATSFGLGILLVRRDWGPCSDRNHHADASVELQKD